MRSLFLHDTWKHSKAAFAPRFGAETVASVSGNEAEYHFVRDAAALTDFSHMQRFSVPEEKGLDFLDRILAGNVAKVRFGRVLHTFLADDAGRLIADCYVANNDEEFVLLCESIVDDAALKAILDKHGAAEAGLKDLSADYLALSLDGYKSYLVAKELFGTDVLGLPYLSIERYPFETETVRLLRVGKTSEFGYLILAPHSCAANLFKTCSALVAKHGGVLCGVNVHNDLRLEGRFFNVFAEGVSVGDPLALGLQWMVDWDKEAFSGRGVIAKNREKGLVNKIIGVSTDAGVKLAKGAAIFDEQGRVAEVAAVCFSYVLNTYIGLALFPVHLAYAGLSFRLSSPTGPVIKTISMPPIMPKSLSVRLDEV
jgi:glycine cleavage system aminomethyltransferase T